MGMWTRSSGKGEVTDRGEVGTSAGVVWKKRIWARTPRIGDIRTCATWGRAVQGEVTLRKGDEMKVWAMAWYADKSKELSLVRCFFFQ